MKVLSVSLIIFFISHALYAQKTEVHIGVPNRMDYAEGIIEHYDNGYLILGGFEYEKGWTVKTDINLEPIWDFAFEFTSLSVYVKASVIDTAGNIYLCGSVDSWPFVTKLNPCSEKIWCKVFKFEDEFDFGYSNDIVINQNDEIVLLTYFNSNDDELDLIHLFGIDNNGDFLWKKPYASKSDHSWIKQPIGESIIEVNDEYYISGSCYWPYPDDTTHWYLRPLFIGIDSLFEEKWILPYAALDSVFGISHKSIPINDSVFMGVGARSGIYQGLLMFYSKGGEDLGYIGIDNNQLGSNVNGSDIRDIARINDSLFIAASLFGPENGGNPGGEFIVSISGNIYGSNSRPGTFIPSIVKTHDDNFVIATSIEENKGDWDIYVYRIDENLNDVPFDPTPHNYDSLCPNNIQSGIINLTDCFIWTDISEAPLPGEYFASLNTIPIKAYPNPVNGNKVTFELQNTQHHENMELKCFDVFGKEVYGEKIYRHQREFKIDISNWQSGIYFTIVYAEGRPVGECKFIVQ